MLPPNATASPLSARLPSAPSPTAHVRPATPQQHPGEAGKVEKMGV